MKEFKSNLGIKADRWTDEENFLLTTWFKENQNQPLLLGGKLNPELRALLPNRSERAIMERRRRAKLEKKRVYKNGNVAPTAAPLTPKYIPKKQAPTPRKLSIVEILDQIITEVVEERVQARLANRAKELEARIAELEDINCKQKQLLQKLCKVREAVESFKL